MLLFCKAPVIKQRRDNSKNHAHILKFFTSSVMQLKYF